MGPGAEQFRGRIDNTRVFRAMATALGLRAPGVSARAPQRNRAAGSRRRPPPHLFTVA